VGISIVTHTEPELKVVFDATKRSGCLTLSARNLFALAEESATLIEWRVPSFEPKRSPY
jgi:hypothetical protein